MLKKAKDFIANTVKEQKENTKKAFKSRKKKKIIIELLIIGVYAIFTLVFSIGVPYLAIFAVLNFIRFIGEIGIVILENIIKYIEANQVKIFLGIVIIGTICWLFRPKKNGNNLQQITDITATLTALRNSFYNMVDTFMDESLIGLTGTLGLFDKEGKGFKGKNWRIDELGIFWVKLTFLRKPNAPEIDKITLEQIRKLLDTAFINVIEKYKKLNIMSEGWSARVYEIFINNTNVAVEILFVDCEAAREKERELDERTGIVNEDSTENNMPSDPDFGG